MVKASRTVYFNEYFLLTNIYIRFRALAFPTTSNIFRDTVINIKSNISRMIYLEQVVI